MSKKLQLSIPTPCHENWDEMTPVQHGKFCDSCQKQVVDFSSMSDRQVAEFFKKPSIGSVCGRFMTDQLDRNIEIPKKRIPWLKYFFQFAIPAFLVSLKSSGQSHKEVVVISQGIKKSSQSKITNALKEKIQEPIITPINTPIKIAELVKIDTSIYKQKKENVPNCGITVRGNVGIRVGGVRSVIANEQPILVVDGVTQNLSLLNKLDPNTIESVTILKRAAATALYGNEAFNGAIIVLSKKAKQDPAVKNSPVEKNLVHSQTYPAIPVEIFPNPISKGGILNLKFKTTDNEMTRIRVLSPDGRLLSTIPVHTDKTKDSFQIQTDNRWSAGIYFVQLLYENGQVAASQKVIIQ